MVKIKVLILLGLAKAEEEKKAFLTTCLIFLESGMNLTVSDFREKAEAAIADITES